MKFVVVKNEFDFKKIRKIKDSKIIIFIKDNIDFQRSIEPINMRNSDVIILGNNKTLSNILIYDDFNSSYNTGIFSVVRNLYVRNLNVINAHIHGGEVCGILAGDVREKFTGIDIGLYGFVDGRNICGGFVGICDFIKTQATYFKGEVSGKSIIGSVAGIANEADIDTIVTDEYDLDKLEKIGCLNSEILAGTSKKYKNCK